MNDQSVKDAVKERYGAVARSTLSSLDPAASRVAQAFGYSAEELASIPAEANMGLSCGNPTAMASLREGETVVDLGSGGGLDVFLAAKKVGPCGKAIGIDMSPEMVERARKNAAESGLTNVEFHLAEIESLPLEDASVDCVISNCVLNLVPDKGCALAEIFRVLKPGGRLAVSDIALKQELPEEVAKSVAAYTGCVAGAILIDTYRDLLVQVGFDTVQIIDSGADLNAYAYAERDASTSSCNTTAAAKPAEKSDAVSCCSTSARTELPVATTGCCSAPQSSSNDLPHELADLIRGFDANAYAASVKVFAVKPA